MISLLISNRALFSQRSVYISVRGLKNSFVLWNSKKKKMEQSENVAFTNSGKSGSRACLIVLSVAVVIFLVVSVVFISLYAVEKSKKTFPSTVSPSKPKYCRSKTCFYTTVGRLILLKAFFLT